MPGQKENPSETRQNEEKVSCNNLSGSLTKIIQLSCSFLKGNYYFSNKSHYRPGHCQLLQQCICTMPRLPSLTTGKICVLSFHLLVDLFVKKCTVHCPYNEGTWLGISSFLYQERCRTLDMYGFKSEKHIVSLSRDLPLAWYNTLALITMTGTRTGNRYEG